MRADDLRLVGVPRSRLRFAAIYPYRDMHVAKVAGAFRPISRFPSPRLETRTKESNMPASAGAKNPRAQ